MVMRQSINRTNPHYFARDKNGRNSAGAPSRGHEDGIQLMNTTQSIEFQRAALPNASQQSVFITPRYIQARGRLRNTARRRPRASDLSARGTEGSERAARMGSEHAARRGQSARHGGVRARGSDKRLKAETRGL